MIKLRSAFAPPPHIPAARCPAQSAEGSSQMADESAAHILLKIRPAARCGTKQEMYQLLRNLADAGAAILFYSTDYDELIGCCDRVLVLYDASSNAS